MPNESNESDLAGLGDRRRFLVVDDHPLFCDALAQALRSHLVAQDVVCADSLAAGIEALEHRGIFTAVLLDLNLPDVTGFDGLIRVKATRRNVPVIVISGLADDRTVANALSAGASGFVPKATAKTELVGALRQVLSGGTYTPPDYRPLTEGASEDAVVARIAELTPQQLRILAQMCEGKLNKQIAYELSIAETTVKAHVTAILRKLKVHSRTQAVLLAKETRFDDGLKAL